MRQRHATPPVTPLRWARRVQGIAVQEAAARNGVTPETWRRWERGLSVPLYPERVAASLGVDVGTVFPGEA